LKPRKSRIQVLQGLFSGMGLAFVFSNLIATSSAVEECCFLYVRRARKRAHLHKHFYFFPLAVLGLELRASSLLGRWSTTSVSLPAPLKLFFSSLYCCAGWGYVVAFTKVLTMIKYIIFEFIPFTSLFYPPFLDINPLMREKHSLPYHFTREQAFSNSQSWKSTFQQMNLGDTMGS
jgi:hypothetical protein